MKILVCLDPPKARVNLESTSTPAVEIASRVGGPLTFLSVASHSDKLTEYQEKLAALYVHCLARCPRLEMRVRNFADHAEEILLKAQSGQFE